MTLLFRLTFFALLFNLYAFPAAAEQSLIRPGDPFPELRLRSPSEPADLEYLRLTADKIFTPSQIKVDLLVVELLNVHCSHCQQQAPAYNELFKLIETSAESKGKIKILGVAAGNLDWEVEAFRKAYQVNFPIIADPSFIAWRAIGGSSTPFTIYVRQDSTGKPGVVTGIHRGLNKRYQQLYQDLIPMAKQDLPELRRKARAVASKNPGIKPVLPPQELEFRVRTAFTQFGLIEDFSKLSLLSGRQVYTAMVRQGETRQRLFAEVSSRSSVCDVCHDVHFIYLFDRSMQVIDFEALHLTKYGNVNWSKHEIKTMREKVVGKYLTMPQPFDPKLDAISSATMTSAIIFDSLSQGKELIDELRTQGLL